MELANLAKRNRAPKRSATTLRSLSVGSPCSLMEEPDDEWASKIEWHRVVVI
jgi:hypothetical protein